MSKIEKALEQLPDKVFGLTRDYKGEIQEAWDRIENGQDLTLTFSVKFSINPKGENCCEVSMGFIKERIRDKTEFKWDEKQEKLPLKTRGKG